ncbi:MAG: ROK family protein [Spirochaetota bacterium]
MERILAAVDIGGTKITASLANGKGIIAKVYQPAKKEGDDKTIPRQIKSMIEYICRKASVKKEKIEAMGISTASPFEKKAEKLVVVAPNLCGGLAENQNVIPNKWSGIPLEEELGKQYRSLRIGNDCITAVVAERLFGAGRGEDNLVYVTWSTGIGAGAFVDGHLLLGKNSNAMHLGHTFLAPNEEEQPLCNCGDHGHLEALVAGPAIARDYGAPTAVVFEQYRKGNNKAIQVIERAAKIFALGLANAGALLDTRLFILGGSVVLNNWDILKPLIQKEFYKAFPTMTREVRFKPSALDKYLGDIAALSLIMPQEWIDYYQRHKPWKSAPEAFQLE